MNLNSDQTVDRQISPEDILRRSNGALSPQGDPDTKTIMGCESVDEMKSTPTPVPVGATIGKYQIRAKLGSGGMGAVFLAFDPIIEREVAIKVLTQEVEASGGALQRFLQEARAIGRLNHPNVVSVYDIDQWQGRYYLVMELLSSGSLGQLVDDHGPVAWQDACRMISQAAAGLAAAHSAGMIHRDIKPENLMLSRDGLVKVVDFGLSKLVDSQSGSRTTVTQMGQILGTPHYMSPEQFEAIDVDLRTDIYSLGATFFRLLTARYPFQDSSSIVQVMTAHLLKPPPTARTYIPDLPEACDRIIQRTMAKRPADRYQNAQELADDLLSIAQCRPKPTAPVVESVSVPSAPPLRSVVIIEPSKMLAGMMRFAVDRAGADRVTVVQTKADARRAILDNPPDLLTTAMQLLDGQAIDLVAELCRGSRLQRTCVVLNSSDSAMDDLDVARTAACRILAPKSVRHDDLLRVVHAAGPAAISQGPLSLPVTAGSLRILVATADGTIPADLSAVLLQGGIRDAVPLTHTAADSLPADLTPTLLLRYAATGTATPISKTSSSLSTLQAVVQATPQGPILLSVVRLGVTAATACPFDLSRLTRLLQACRPA